MHTCFIAYDSIIFYSRQMPEMKKQVSLEIFIYKKAVLFSIYSTRTIEIKREMQVLAGHVVPLTMTALINFCFDHKPKKAFIL